MSRQKARKFIIHNKIEAPFDVDLASIYLNARIVYKDFGEIGAVLLFKKDKRLIAVNNNYEIKHQRFFIAHEFAHILLGHKETSYCIPNQNKKNYNEKLADVCARELLIPTHDIKILSKKYNYNVKLLKEIFWVTELDMVIKLRNLGLPYQNTVYRNF